MGTFVLYNVPITAAASAVLAYRAIALWVPAILGSAAFVSLRRTLRRESAEIAVCAPPDRDGGDRARARRDRTGIDGPTALSRTPRQPARRKRENGADEGGGYLQRPGSYSHCRHGPLRSQ